MCTWIEDTVAIYTDLKIDESALHRLFNAGRFLDELQGLREFLRLIVRNEAKAAKVLMNAPRQVERGRIEGYLGKFWTSRCAFENE